MKNYDYWKKSQITDISTFCYWLHKKGVGIYVNPTPMNTDGSQHMSCIRFLTSLKVTISNMAPWSWRKFNTVSTTFKLFVYFRILLKQGDFLLENLCGPPLTDQQMIMLLAKNMLKPWLLKHNYHIPSYSLFRGDVTSSINNESAIFRRWKSNLNWWMFHRLNDKGDNSLTEIPGCPEERLLWYYWEFYNRALGTKKIMCVYCHMSKKSRVGRSGLLFF